MDGAPKLVAYEASCLWHPHLWSLTLSFLKRSLIDTNSSHATDFFSFFGIAMRSKFTASFRNSSAIASPAIGIPCPGAMTLGDSIANRRREAYASFQSEVK